MHTTFRPDAKWFMRLAIVCAAYYVGGRLGLSVPYVGSHVSLIWPPAGIALAAMLRCSTALWPAVWLGAFGVNLAIGSSPALAFGIACGNTFGPWLAARLLRRHGFDSSLPRRRDLVLFLAVGVLGGMAINASNGVLQLWLAGALPERSAVAAWTTWWLGDAIGALVVGIPLLTARRRPWQRMLGRTRRVELIVALSLTLATAYFVFFRIVGDGSAHPALYLPFLLLCWLAIRGGAAIASSAVLLLAAAAVTATANGGGPFQAASMHDSLALLWAYIATTAVITVLVTVLVGELRESEARLRESEERYRLLLNNSPVGILHFDPKLVVTYANGRFEEIMQVPRGHMIGLDCHTLRDQSVVPAMRTALTGEHARYEGPYITTHGSVDLWLSMACAPVYDDDGRILGGIVIAEDITDRKEVERELQKFRFFSDHASDAYILIDEDTRIRYANEKACEQLGYDAAELLAMHVPDIDPHYDRERVLAHFERCKLGRTPAFETVHRRKDGALVPVEIMSTALQIDGEWLAFTASRDISARKEADSQLRLAARVFSHAHEGIMICDAGHRIIDVNPTFTEITGYGRDEVLGHTPAVLSSGRQDAEFYCEMQHAIESEGHWEGELVNRRKDGTTFVERLRISTVRDDDGRISHYIGTFSDNTALSEQQARLEALAHYDPLTQLPNRTLLSDRMEQALAQAKRTNTVVAVCYLDLDGFKAVNDELGHEGGDALLVEIARRLKDSVRTADTVARLGGDEFAVLLVGIRHAAECDRAAQRMLRAIAAPVRIHEHERRVSGSIGITLFPDDASDADTLIRHADNAMYAAKQAGKNRYHLHDTARDEKLRFRREALDRIRRALDDGEFRLHYQPIADMRRGVVIAFEALIRWQHPERGLLGPDEFLPVVEGSELDVAIGRWVFAEGIRQLAEWRARGLPQTLNVNVSAADLLSPAFVDELAAQLAAQPGLERHALQLEITETAAIEDLEAAIGVFRRCHDLGVDIALDDFGTGYSTLSYFRRLPVSTLKIDRVFVQSLGNPEDLAIVDSVIGLTRAFGRKLVAEGVETPEAARLLMSMGCAIGQGFGIARPMPAEAVPGWVAGFALGPDWAPPTANFADEDRPLLLAEFDHRAWVRQMGAWLDGDRDTPTAPPLDSLGCRFGRWYSSEGLKRYGGFESFRALGDLHEAVHREGRELARLRDVGHLAEARDRFEALVGLRDRMVEALAAVRSEAVFARN